MDEDITIQIARARNTLRLAARSGRRTSEACRALDQLLRLARSSHDTNLHFEYCRWSVHLSCMRG
jgi:hypothetical protein